MNDNDYKMFKLLIIENIVIYICVTIIVVGLFLLSRDLLCLMGFSLLIFVNFIKKQKDKKINE